jgi:hypothetical protein
MNTLFDNIYVLYINETELGRIKHKINKKNIKVEYFMGIDGRELQEEFDKQNNISTIGAYGHIHSFINILKDSIIKNYEKILILESDIYFSINFTKEIEKIRHINYKLLYLGASQHKWYNHKHLIKNEFYPAYETYGTFALCLDNSILTEYLHILEKKEKPSDTCLLELQKKYKNECFVYYPNIIICDLTKSSTSGERNQAQYMEKFKWDRSYVIDENYNYEIEKNNLYATIILLNSFKKEKQGYIKIYNNTFYLPDENLKDVVSIKKENGIIEHLYCYIIHFFSHGNNIILYTNNLFIKKINLIRKNKSSLIIKKYLNTKENHIKKYYTDLCKILNKHDEKNKI